MVCFDSRKVAEVCSEGRDVGSRREAADAIRTPEMAVRVLRIVNMLLRALDMRISYEKAGDLGELAVTAWVGGRLGRGVAF